MHSRTSVVTFTCALLATFVHSPVSAQVTLSERVWKATNSVLVTFRDPRAKGSIWRLARPISFNVVDTAAVATAEDLIRTAVLPSILDEGCIGRTLDKLAADSQSPPTITDDELALTEAAYLKEKNLSKRDLDNYKSYRARYLAEKRRLATLDADQAQAESYKIKQIETEWETIGKRSEFLELEKRISKLARPLPPVDVSSLRNEIYNGDKKIIFKLSVPVNLWNQYDAWVHVKKTGNDQTSLPNFREVETPKGVKFNEGSCAANANACISDVKGSFSKGTAIAVSVLAPQFDLPWLSKFSRASAGVRGAVGNCFVAGRLDRLILVQGVGTSFEMEQLVSIGRSLVTQKPLLEDSIQFAGVPDMGVAYFATPSFADGMLVSPYSFLLGFTTVELDPLAK